MTEWSKRHILNSGFLCHLRWFVRRPDAEIHQRGVMADRSGLPPGFKTEMDTSMPGAKPSPHASQGFTADSRRPFAGAGISAGARSPRLWFPLGITTGGMSSILGLLRSATICKMKLLIPCPCSLSSLTRLLTANAVEKS
jgi:hypothetical protein